MDELIRQQAIADAVQAAVPLREFLHAKNGDVYDWALSVERQVGQRYAGHQRAEYHCALLEVAKETEQ